MKKATVARRPRQKAPRGSGKRASRRIRPLAVILYALIVVLGCFLGWMRVRAGLVELKTADVYLSDLPDTFEGKTLLYFSDANIKSAAELRATEALMKKLATLEPDIVIFGGGIGAEALDLSSSGAAALAETSGDSRFMPGVTSAPEVSLPVGTPASAATEAVLPDLGGNALPESAGTADGLPAADTASGLTASQLTRFASALGSIRAGLGCYAVAGQSDLTVDGLEAIYAAAGVTLLRDNCATLRSGDAQLILAGLNDTHAGTTPYAKIGGYFDGRECVVAVCGNPTAYIGIRVSEARAGGTWADLVLSGGTLGGQVKLFGRTLVKLTAEEQRFLSGWYSADDLPMLVSTGLGCRSVNLRLGTQPEVWLITLHRQAVVEHTADIGFD